MLSNLPPQSKWLLKLVVLTLGTYKVLNTQDKIHKACYKAFDFKISMLLSLPPQSKWSLKFIALTLRRYKVLNTQDKSRKLVRRVLISK